MDKNEILNRMKRINNFLKNKEADFSSEEFVQIDILAKTVNIELTREYTEDYISGIRINITTEDPLYHELWCNALGTWSNDQINNLCDTICEFCEKNGLTLNRVALKFDTAVASVIDLLIEDTLVKRSSQRFLDHLVSHNEKLPMSRRKELDLTELPKEVAPLFHPGEVITRESWILKMMKQQDDAMDDEYFNSKQKGNGDDKE